LDRISVRTLASAVRFLREPVVVTYSYPRSHPLYGAGEETGVYVPMAVWTHLAEDAGIPPIEPGIVIPDEPARVSVKVPGMADE